eukprot:scaffold544_cov220-Chaetoceros_neogracile.AAC.6
MVSLSWRTVLCVWMLSSSAAAWSTGPSSFNRRGFLQNAQKVAVVIGTSSVSGGGLLVENAQAATPKNEKNKIYQPPNSLVGKVMVITGASSGLGLESAKRLAAAGATVVMTTRTTAKADTAKSEVQQYLQDRSIDNKDIYALTLNMDDLSDVRSFPDRYAKVLDSRKIDVLMNNIGLISQSREITKDNLEKTFQSNHLGPFLLTSGLFPLLNRNGSRIVNVASKAHQFAKVVSTGKPGLDMNNLDGSLSYGLDGWEAYGNTKLENVLFTQELQRRADAAGCTWLTVASLHPGVVGTDLWKNTALAKPDNDKFSLQSFASGLFFKNTLTNEEGANTQIMLATSDTSGIKRGGYYDEFGQLVKLDAFAQDQVKARELWDVSENLSSCKFNVA